MAKNQMDQRIAELEATPRALVGSDSGSGQGSANKPLEINLYEEITGERYATRSFAGANATRCTVTEGIEASEANGSQMRHFGDSEREIRAKARELGKLRMARRKLT